MSDEYHLTTNYITHLEASHKDLIVALEQCDKYNSRDETYNQSEFAVSIRRIISMAKEVSPN